MPANLVPDINGVPPGAPGYIPTHQTGVGLPSGPRLGEPDDRDTSNRTVPPLPAFDFDLFKQQNPLAENFAGAFTSLTPEQIRDLVGIVGQGFSTEQAAGQLGFEIPELAGILQSNQDRDQQQRQQQTDTSPNNQSTAPPRDRTLPPLPLPPEGGAPNPGTQFAPDFQFAIDPNNPDSTTAFINALLTALGPGIASGQFSNFQRSPNDLGNAFAGFESGSPFENMLNQLLSSQLQGGAGGSPVDFASGGQGSVQDLISSLFGQPSGQSLSTGRASELFQQLLSSGGTGSNLQAFTEQQLRGSISGGGISPEFVTSARERILAPANEALLGRLNQQGGGVADLSSPLFQELQRRQESDFANDLILFGGQNQSNLLGQAASLGQNQFQNIFGVGQAQGELGQNQQQINQGAIGLAGMLQNLFAQQGFQASGQGLTREELALQNQQQENEFGLGQSAITSDLIQTLLAGREGGGGFGTILSLLFGGEGGTNIFDIINSGIDIFRNPNPDPGEDTNPCIELPDFPGCGGNDEPGLFEKWCRDNPNSAVCAPIPGDEPTGTPPFFPPPDNDDDCNDPTSRRFLEGECGIF